MLNDVEYESTAIQTEDVSEIRRDEGWSWIVLLAAFSTLFITNGIHTSFGILYAALISEFRSGFEETAWVGSISLGFLCFFSPIASLLIEQIGCRATSAIGGLLCSLGFLLSSFASDISVLYFTHGVLFGLGTSLTYTVAMLVVTRCFERRRNIATGLCTSGSQFGGISLAPLCQVLFDRLGFANTFRTLSALLLFVAISCLAYKPSLVENRTIEPSDKKSPREMFLVWKNKAYVVWALATTLIVLGYNVPRYTVVKYAIDQGISKDAAAWLISYVCLTSAVGRILFGRISDWIPALPLCQSCLFSCALAAFLIPFLKSYSALVVICLVLGLPDGGFISSLTTVTLDIVGPEKMSEGFGFMLFCQSYSNIVGPPLSGMLFDTYGSYIGVFCFAAIPEICGACALFLIPCYKKNQVNYRQEINFQSQSVGTMVENATDLERCKSDVNHDTAKVGNYNVIINIPSNTTDVKHVNVIIQKPEAKFIDSIPDDYIKMIASNTTIIASDSLSVHNDITKSNMNEPAPVVDNEIDNDDTNIRIDIMEKEPCTNITEQAVQVIRKGHGDDEDEEMNREIGNLLPTLNTSHRSIRLDSPVKCSSDLSVFSPVLTEDNDPTIIQFNGEPALTAPVYSVKPGNLAYIGENGYLSEREKDPQTNTTTAPLITTTATFPTTFEENSTAPMQVTPDMVNTNLISNDAADTFVTNSGLIAKSPGTGTIKSNLMANTLPTSIASPDTITNNNSAIAPNEAFPIVQDHLPEPLKPTSVCSVQWAQRPSETSDVALAGNQDKALVTSPLSCELSTVIADVIQSLTSQNTAKGIYNKESDNYQVTGTICSDQQLLETKFEHLPPTFDAPKKNITKQMRSTVTQTSVLNTMQSIVAEGCPEDSSLLQDISIDLSLDKDPSLASLLIDTSRTELNPLTPNIQQQLNTVDNSQIASGDEPINPFSSNSGEIPEKAVSTNPFLNDTTATSTNENTTTAINTNPFLSIE